MPQSATATDYVRRLTSLALVALAVSCQSPVGIEEVRGSWVLESVNGTPIPGSVEIGYLDTKYWRDHGTLARKTVYIDESVYRFSNITGARLDGFAGTFQHLGQGEVLWEGIYHVDTDAGVLTTVDPADGLPMRRFEIDGSRMIWIEEYTGRDLWQPVPNRYLYRRQ